MSDMTKRLRDDDNNGDSPTAWEAADRIEKLEAALASLLPGYEQYLEWAVERRVLFIKDGRSVLAAARAVLANG